jgi:hypothetical protein
MRWELCFCLGPLDGARQKLNDFKSLAFEVLGNWAPDLVGRMIGASEPYGASEPL